MSGYSLSESERSCSSILAANSDFAGLRPDHLAVLREHSMRVHYRQGDVILRQGDPANRFYLIETGEVAVETTYRENFGARLDQIGRGQILGCSWLTPPYRWQFTAKALVPTSAIFFYASRIREYCEIDKELGYELLARMSETIVKRLASARHRMEASLR